MRFNPESSSALQSFAYSLDLQCNGGENWKRKSELIGWDKNSSLGQKTKKEITLMRNDINNAHSNCSLPANQCPDSPQAVAALSWTIPLMFVSIFSWCHMVRNIPLSILCHLSSFCPLPGTCTYSRTLVGRTEWKTEKLKCLCHCTPLLSNYWCIINMVFLLKPQHNIIVDIMRKISCHSWKWNTKFTLSS